MSKVSVEDIVARKKLKQRITMLTCYDYSFAQILDMSGIDMLLVGDSLANVVLGLDQTRKVSLSEMFNHTRAVASAVKRALVVADMPYAAYQKDPDKAVYNAKKFLSCGAQAVKVEWFPAFGKKGCLWVVRQLIKHRVAVMGHIGLTPQTVHLLGGYRVQGRNSDSAKSLLEQAKKLSDLGVFSIVLECIPATLAKQITDSINIPTIGIGAGKACDGQVLVLYDMLGLYGQKKLKFVRVYKDLASQVKDAAEAFITDVTQGGFPSSQESYE